MGMSGDEGPIEDLSEGRTRLDATQPRSLTISTLLLMTRTLFKNILQGLLPAHSMLCTLPQLTAPSAEPKSEGEHDRGAKLEEQESPFVKLAELYRDQNSVSRAF